MKNPKEVCEELGFADVPGCLKKLGDCGGLYEREIARGHVSKERAFCVKELSIERKKTFSFPINLQFPAIT